ncbi:MAG: hypothetical protein U5K54_18170 [Cytophagales bacterium]|nr:hypothetical protein [Cytophagales bacterium]
MEILDNKEYPTAESLHITVDGSLKPLGSGLTVSDTVNGSPTQPLLLVAVTV